MEAWVLIFSITSFFSLLAKHSCQVSPDHNDHSDLSPIIILPASSGISYESLHYPVPVDQQYQVIPLVINTGKIPLINHAVQAPIQYFVPNNENRRRAPIYDSVRGDEGLRLKLQRNPDDKSAVLSYSNDAQTENRPTYRDDDGSNDNNNYPPAATATVYSETRVDGPPASRRYSYGYKIVGVRHDVGGSTDRHDAPMMQQVVGGDGPASYNSLSGPDETDGVFGRTAGPGAGLLQATANRRKPDESDGRRDDGPDDSPGALKPIVMKTAESNTTRTELKKYYKKAANPETPVKVTKTTEN